MKGFFDSYTKSYEEVLNETGTDPQSGIKEQETEFRRSLYGENKFTKTPQKTYLKRIVDGLKEPMILLLVGAAIVTLAVNSVRLFNGAETEFVECIGILIAISLSVGINVIMEGKSAKAFESLNKIKDNINVRVIRDGSVNLIPQSELVVGDIILVETGDKLAADGRVIHSDSLSVDESALTGETMAVKKHADTISSNIKTPLAERNNMLYSGCFVAGGNGKMVVCTVGDSTEFGQIAKELSSSVSTTTPIEEKLANLGKSITVIGVVIALIVFVIQLINVAISETMTINTISEAFITSIVLIVATVPEGLPTIIAVSLAINVIKLSKENALVKKLVACETIGATNIICSDKTGTLTKNQMTVIKLYENNKLIEPNNITNDYLIKNCCLNSTAHVDFSSSTNEFIGSATECALLSACHMSGYDYNNIRNTTDIIKLYPFSSETKNMTTVACVNGKYISYSKGSPEKILSFCNIENSLKEKIEKNILHFQEMACRTISFSHKELSNVSSITQNDIEKDMIYDGFAVISDPLRDDVFEAVKSCQSAGIDIKILTGDNLITAKAIGANLNLVDDKHLYMEAVELDELTDEEFNKILPKIRIIARSTPTIKMRVVNSLKALGNVVAVTGDGINDAPAIKNADVGIAMGISGTEVSKDASDIVLLDDSFATIVTAVKWGRGIYKNFQRFIQFQLTVNLASVVVVLASILTGLAAPFSALQLLWINLVMDGPPGLTLGLEPIQSNLMKNNPTPRNANIITKDMLKQIVFNGSFISLMFMIQSRFNILGAEALQQPTVLFTSFIVFQLFNAINSRSLTNESCFKGVLSNKLMLIVFTFTFLLQVVITQFAGALFKTTPLPFDMWMKIILFTFTVVLASELFKFFTRLFQKDN